MAKLRVHNVSVSFDGYMAGPDQALERPLGAGGEKLHTWVFATASIRERFGMTGGATGVDNDFILVGEENIGAHILGRNMFGPGRSSPQPRTTFHLVTGGIEAARGARRPGRRRQGRPGRGRCGHHRAVPACRADR